MSHFFLLTLLDKNQTTAFSCVLSIYICNIYEAPRDNRICFILGFKKKSLNIVYSYHKNLQDQAYKTKGPHSSVKYADRQSKPNKHLSLLLNVFQTIQIPLFVFLSISCLNLLGIIFLKQFIYTIQ